MKRLTRDEYFLALTNLVAARATCDRLWAGCVLVKDGEVLSTGYNGAPSGMEDCDTVGHLLVERADGRQSCVRAVHGEQNALYQARKRVPNLQGVTAYINTTPCEICLSELLRYGIKRIVCGSRYSNARGQENVERLVRVWGAVMEYKPMPDITLSFGTEVTEVKRIQIERAD